LFLGGDFRDQTSEGFGEQGDREATGLDLKGEENLLEEFKDGAGIGSDGNNSVLRRMKRARGVAEGGGFTRSDLSRDDTDGTEFEGIKESVCQSLEAGQRIKILDPDILREGISLKAEKVFIANHCSVSFRRVFLPDRRVSSEVRRDNFVGVRCW
jgi:hypothetical protein